MGHRFRPNNLHGSDTLSGRIPRRKMASQLSNNHETLISESTKTKRQAKSRQHTLGITTSVTSRSMAVSHPLPEFATFETEHLQAHRNRTPSERPWQAKERPPTTWPELENRSSRRREAVTRHCRLWTLACRTANFPVLRSPSSCDSKCDTSSVYGQVRVPSSHA